MFAAHVSLFPQMGSFELIASLVSFGLVCLLVSLSRARSHLPLPPGPKKRPLIGNALDLRMKDEWVTYKRWADEHSASVEFQVFLP